MGLSNSSFNTIICYVKNLKENNMIRELIRPQNGQLIINIPKEYIDKEVEVLVFPVPQHNDEPIQNNVSANLEAFRTLMKKAKKTNRKLPKGVDIDDLIDEMYEDISWYKCTCIQLHQPGWSKANCIQSINRNSNQWEKSSFISFSYAGINFCPE